MPVRSLNSSILRWPSKPEVDQALRQWVKAHASALPDGVAIGYFGSYARGDAGVGSDLDVLMLITDSDVPFSQRNHQWDFLSIPVPVEALVYTLTEWKQLKNSQPRFYQTLQQETVWVKGFPPAISQEIDTLES